MAHSINIPLGTLIYLINDYYESFVTQPLVVLKKTQEAIDQIISNGLQACERGLRAYLTLILFAS